MFGEISLMAWMGSAIVFAIGGAAGFFIARQIKDKRTLELEQQLQATQSKLTDYQDDVNHHFLKTSLLFNKLTDNYREVYEHLATGAQKLCNEKPITTALDLPDTKILSAAVATSSESNSEKPQTSAAPTPTPEHEQSSSEQETEEEHLGVESIAAHQGTFESTDAKDTKENIEAPADDKVDTRKTNAATNNASQQADAERSQKPAENRPESDVPVISEEELKILEASEQEKEEAEDVHLGAESTPGVELDHHKTHPAIH